MIERERTLRHVIESWLGADRARGVRVTRFRRSQRRLCRCVRVEALSDRKIVTILFFRHGDGSWRVFPPAPHRPVMGGAMNAEDSVKAYEGWTR